METAKVVRTSIGLRDALFDEFDALRAGRTNPQRASAMAKLAVQIINSVRIEIDHQRHVISLADAASHVTPSAVLQLGTDPAGVNVKYTHDWDELCALFIGAREFRHVTREMLDGFKDEILGQRVPGWYETFDSELSGETISKWYKPESSIVSIADRFGISCVTCSCVFSIEGYRSLEGRSDLSNDISFFVSVRFNRNNWYWMPIDLPTPLCPMCIQSLWPFQRKHYNRLRTTIEDDSYTYQQREELRETVYLESLVSLLKDKDFNSRLGGTV